MHPPSMSVGSECLNFSVLIHTASPSLAYWSQPSSSPLPGLRSMSLFQFLLIIACDICFLLMFFLTLYSLLWAGTFFLRKMRETMAMMKAGSSWCLKSPEFPLMAGSFQLRKVRPGRNSWPWCPSASQTSLPSFAMACVEQRQSLSSPLGSLLS